VSRRPYFAVAIDGPASSGKGTVARLVARELNFAYIDTGAMYRAVALLASRRGVSWDDGDMLGLVAAGLKFDFRWGGDALEIRVDGEDISAEIRGESVGQGASAVARFPLVRAALLGRQRQLSEQGDVVMDGRDIGTVVLPGAALKVYLDANLEERARRRHLEMVERGEAAEYASVHRELAARDAQDMGRAAAPLKAADDAVRLDTTGLTPGDAAARVVALARARGA